MLPGFTKNQILLLEVFFNDPEKSRYLREIGRIVNKEPGVFQKDIKKLSEAGILESYYDGNRHFFKLNKNYFLFEELKSIFFKTVGVKARLREGLKKIKGIKKAFIYGSFARGDEKSASDIDLFVIGSINEDELLDFISGLEKSIGRECDYILMSEKEYERKLNEGSSFLKNILSRDIIELV